MNMMQIAETVRQWYAAAVGDIAYESVDYSGNISCFCGSELVDIINKGKERGVRDLVGWLADELYNSPYYVDMIGDRIYELCEEHGVSKLEVYKRLKLISGGAIPDYCDERIKNEEGESQTCRS